MPPGASSQTQEAFNRRLPLGDAGNAARTCSVGYLFAQ